MELYEAKNIITEVFENPFDKDKFSYFIRNLLNNLHPAVFLRTGYNIPKAFEDFIASYERLGKYEDEEGNLIDVLIIKLKRDHSIDYARSTQRNFVRWYLNGKGKDAALVAFTTEKSSEWRFSFIKMQYSLEKKKDELTPAKRSSFMVGESGNSHTAQRQLIDLLKNDHAPYLSDIEDAFSIEAVSDEFYEKYKALLFNLVDEIEKIVKKDNTVKEEFESKNISILNFSKKLLGQIVFLYFLQKKGWLGLDEKAKYGEGDKSFLRSLFNKTKPEENFFNDYLEFLFYDALSKKRVTDYYERFKTRIPFLNGGLFDPIEFYDWQKTDIVIPNEIFSNRKSDEEGTGIFDVFDLYNFTVKEDEPLETEVAIDPEMLGKVFERMLEVTERKSKGAFYTPREIVHYMAQQSLLYFLETELNQTVSYNKLGDKQSEIFGNEGRKGQLGLLKENKACVVPKADLETFIHFGEHIIDKDIAIEEGKLKQTANKQSIPESIRQHADAIDQALKNIKICDPAVGSGAFPVGIMNEIVKLRKLLTPFLKRENAEERSAYRFKLNAIQNSIYGVDIDAGAVEIAKLRLWLSMVVDEERIDTIEPLPNLEYKIVQGNSLLGYPYSPRGLKEVEKLKNKYFSLTDKDKKQRQKEIIDSKIFRLFENTPKSLGYQVDFDFKINFSEVFHEKRGFDVVIGNPPYLESRSPEFKNSLKKDLQHAVLMRWREDSKLITKGSDLLIYFFELSCKLINPLGNIVLITQNSWLDTEYGKKFQSFLLKKTNVEAIIDSDYKYFDSKQGPNINTVISIFRGHSSVKDGEIFFIRFHKSFGELPTGLFQLNKNDNNALANINIYNRKDDLIQKHKWGVLLSSEKDFLKLLEIIHQKGTFLEDIKDNYLSVGQGLNITKDYIINSEIIKKFTFLKDALFPIMTKSEGAPFELTKTENYLINKFALTFDQRELLKKEDKVKVFDPSYTRKKPPLLIMPRGIGRHFCAINSANAFSTSYVEIYDNLDNVDEEIKFNLWLFLNSSVAWLIREISGRKNLGGGMLKAESIDIKAFPLIYNFGKLSSIKKIFSNLQKREAFSSIKEINSPDHKQIDKIVFEYLGIDNPLRKSILLMLEKKINERTSKSITT